MKGDNLLGQRFGRWTVIKAFKENRSLFWICECDCGTIRKVYSASLRNGVSQSCGCLNREKIISLSTKHGMHGKTLYSTWKGMKQRCSYKKGKEYKNYGGRGIRVCDEWQKDFKVFYDWAIENGYSEGLTIDRIDINGNYEPGNCRWITLEEQALNKTTNRFVTLNGVSKPVKKWCDDLKLNYQIVMRRIYAGWSIEKALEMKG